MSKIKGGAAYRRLRQSRAKTYELELPSGAVFEVQEVDLSVFAVSGALPTAVGEKMLRGKDEGLSAQDAFAKLSTAEKEAGFRFSKKLLKAFCVNPKIVDDPQTEDELAIEELLPEDFEYLINAATGGDRLDSFRDERQQSSALESDGAVLQGKTERASGTKSR